MENQPSNRAAQMLNHTMSENASEATEKETKSSPKSSMNACDASPEFSEYLSEMNQFLVF